MTFRMADRATAPAEHGCRACDGWVPLAGPPSAADAAGLRRLCESTQTTIVQDSYACPQTWSGVSAGRTWSVRCWHGRYELSIDNGPGPCERTYRYSTDREHRSEPALLEWVLDELTALQH